MQLRHAAPIYSVLPPISPTPPRPPSSSSSSSSLSASLHSSSRLSSSPWQLSPVMDALFRTSSSASAPPSPDLPPPRSRFLATPPSRLPLRRTTPKIVAPIQCVAREIPKLNSRVNHTSATSKDGGPKLFGEELEAKNGAAVLPDDPPVSLDKNSLDVVLTFVAAAIAASEKRKSVGEEMQTKTQVSIDALRRGRLVENCLVYRQTFVIRSYEVGFDRTASIETLANLFQETALNHVGMSDFVGDGMGTTHAMMRHRLIWVVTKMHIQVVQYPVWGDVVEIDSWVSGSGKNGMRRDFLVRDYLSGQIRARATSNWAMMNQDTRKLSKMPDDVRAEISPHFLDRCVMTDEPCQRIIKLDDSAPHIKAGLVPRLHDMDMNQHVNHVKYISWVLESVPQSLLVAYELKGMTLEYRKECNHSDVVSSLTLPESPLSPCVDGSYTQSGVQSETGPPSIKNPRITTTGPLHYTHLLRLQGDGTEILRGRTVWKLKKRYS